MLFTTQSLLSLRLRPAQALKFNELSFDRLSRPPSDARCAEDCANRCRPACKQAVKSKSKRRRTWPTAKRTCRAPAACNSARNAGLSAASAQLVRITHPFHPFADRLLTCVGERYNRSGKRLLLRVGDGTVCSVPPQWTDLVAPDPSNRLVADTLEGEWNDKLRALAKTQEERERARQADQLVLDDAIRDRLVALTTDFKTLWRDPSLPNRERKRLLAYLIEDVTLVKLPAEGTTRIHVRFKGGKTETLTTANPKSSAQQVKTHPKVVELVDTLLDNHIYPEIADILNERGIRPGGSARRGQADAQFTALRVAYLAHEYGLRSRYDRLRDRGMLTREEGASRLGICESTLVRWEEHGLVARHAYNAHAYLYEAPGSNSPVKHCSRWDRLIDRAAATKRRAPKSLASFEGDAV